MDKEEVQNEVEVVDTPQETVEEQETTSLVSLIKEASELSRISAVVNLAYVRAKSVDKVKAGCKELSKTMDEKVKATVGAIKENSKLYDEIKVKKATVSEKYGEVLEAVTNHYDKKIEELLTEKARLESENLAIVADNQNLKLDQKDKQSEYKKSERSQKDSDVNKAILAKKAEAEKLAKSGDLEGAQAAIEEYKKLKDSLVKETTGGVLEIATISQQIKMNKEQFRANQNKIKKIEEAIEKLENDKETKIDTVCKLEDKALDKIDQKTSIFKKLAMFASKTITRTFNKGKAINDQVFEPMKKKIEVQLPVIEESIGTKLSEIKTNAKESFKDKLNKVMEFGRNTKQGAIDKLKARNDKKRETLQNRQQYLEDRSEK